MLRNIYQFSATASTIYMLIYLCVLTLLLPNTLTDMIILSRFLIYDVNKSLHKTGNLIKENFIAQNQFANQEGVNQKFSPRNKERELF